VHARCRVAVTLGCARAHRRAALGHLSAPDWAFINAVKAALRLRPPGYRCRNVDTFAIQRR
jgi:hypothetical protein